MIMRGHYSKVFFFFNDTATTEIYTLSLHDALPISPAGATSRSGPARGPRGGRTRARAGCRARSEEHTSELQSLAYLVCRLLLEKKKKVEIRHLSDSYLDASICPLLPWRHIRLIHNY